MDPSALVKWISCLVACFLSTFFGQIFQNFVGIHLISSYSLDILHTFDQFIWIQTGRRTSVYAGIHKDDRVCRVFYYFLYKKKKKMNIPMGLKLPYTPCLTSGYQSGRLPAIWNKARQTPETDAGRLTKVLH
jgi:hypothetical protein